MANGDAIAYNIATFVSTLFLLEFGADKFVDHTAIVARRTRIPGTIIALLTAGAEWEEVSFNGPKITSDSLLIMILVIACRRYLLSCPGAVLIGSGQYYRVRHFEYPRRLLAWPPIR